MVKSAALPVILVTHSKGSVDTLTMLTNNPSVREKIAGWVSIQGAVQGSTVADFLVGTGTTPAIIEAANRAVLSVVFEHVFKGSLGALDSLRTSDRVEYLRRNAAEIDKIVARIPIVAYGSAAPMSRSTLRTLTDPFCQRHPEISVDRLHGQSGRQVQYRVIPMVGPDKDNLRPDDGDASEWTKEITLSHEVTPKVQAYFNRGIVAAQWVSRRLGITGDNLQTKKLETVIATPGDPFRNFLTGPLGSKLFDLMSSAAKAKDDIYAALYELNDQQLEDALATRRAARDRLLGRRVRVQ